MTVEKPPGVDAFAWHQYRILCWVLCPVRTFRDRWCRREA